LKVEGQQRDERQPLGDGEICFHNFEKCGYL